MPSTDIPGATNENAPPTSDDRGHGLADDFVSVEAVCATLRSYADDREDARENEDDVFEADYARTILSAIETSSWLAARVAAAVAAERERIAVAIESAANCSCRESYCAQRATAKRDARIARSGS